MNPNYTVQKSAESFRIYPKNRKGETIPLTVSRRLFILKHASGDEVTIKEYIHRGHLLWSDSRRKGPCGKEHAIKEVARMLFRGDLIQAEQFLD